MTCTYCDEPAVFFIDGYVEDGQDGRFARNPVCYEHSCHFDEWDMGRIYLEYGFSVVTAVTPIEPMPTPN